jgi:23S rRNA (cytidine1920-2'-O)/16S rRNA (cytidine1409-2'-O)-methyltransferase
MAKIRLDLLLTQKNLADSRSRAQALIMAGKVRVNGVVVNKAGMPISEDADIEVEQPLPYVSRGGIKLAAAIEAFNINPVGLVCADVGASTGGFTDVLLQKGAHHVYAIDVGYGQLAWKLRQDERVTVMERTNARYVEHLTEPVGLVTIDASFISLRLILSAVKKWLSRPAAVIALVKPQFEAGKDLVGKGGVVRDPRIHEFVLKQVCEVSLQLGYVPAGLVASPITGPAGNHEFLLYLSWFSACAAMDIESAVASCLQTVGKSTSES